MRTGKWFANGIVAVGLLVAGGFAFANGYIRDSSLLDKVPVGVTTSKQVTEILGPPFSVSQYPRRGIDDDGIVRNVQQLVR